MSDVEPQVPEEDGRDRRKMAWLFWAVPIIVLLGAALGTVGAVGGFSTSGGHSPAPVFAPASSVASPTLTQYPDNPTTLNNAHFKWTDSTTGVTFRCQLDSGGYGSCKSPTNYNQLADGDHCFYVVAVKGVNTSSPTSYCWTILANKTFGITGNLSQALYPGADPQALNLTLQNPYNFALQVTSITVSVPSTNKSGCSVSTNFQVYRQFSGTVTIPASTSETLKAAGATDSQLPEIQMIDTGKNQDACQTAIVQLSYSGQGQKP